MDIKLISVLIQAYSMETPENPNNSQGNGVLGNVWTTAKSRRTSQHGLESHAFD
jgi:hypothetical protein